MSEYINPARGRRARDPLRRARPQQRRRDLLLGVAQDDRAPSTALDRNDDRRRDPRGVSEHAPRTSATGDGAVPTSWTATTTACSRAGSGAATASPSTALDRNDDRVLTRAGVQHQNASNSGPSEFRALDRNNDGVISRREWRGDRDTFDRLDRNDDGGSDPREFNNSRWPRRALDQFRALDRNRDGVLSRSEWLGNSELRIRGRRPRRRAEPEGVRSDRVGPVRPVPPVAGLRNRDGSACSRVGVARLGTRRSTPSTRTTTTSSPATSTIG